MNNFVQIYISELIELLTINQIKEIKFQNAKKYKKIISTLLNQLKSEQKKK